MRRFSVGLIFTVLAPCAATYGSEYQQVEDIAPESAEEAAVALDDVTEAPPTRPQLRLFRGRLAEKTPFLRDSSLDMGVRVYDFRREDGTEPIAEAFAAGTELTFRSGKWKDRFSLALSWHTSFEIDAPDDRGGSGILAPDQSDLSVISRAYLQYELGKVASLRLYRQDFNMPYINRQDSRMIPNTHEAYVLMYPGERAQWILGQVTKMKKRDSEEFVPMGEIAGLPGDDSGTTVAGVRYKFANDTQVGALLQRTDDLFTTAYSELSHKRTLTENWGLQNALQVTNQQSTGRELIGEFDTYSWGLRSALSYRGAVLTLAYTKTGDAEIRKPFGGTPGYTSSMLFDFDRAREEAFQIGLSQNFAKYGFPGASLILKYTEGHSARTDLGVPLDDADEFAVTADFRPPKGPLKGLWLRIRYSNGDRGSPAADRRDIRVILNFSAGAFR